MINFLEDTRALFKGAKVSHMGPHQFVPHTALRNGRPMSGALLWAEAEGHRLSSSSAMFNTETILLHAAAKEIENYVSRALPVVDLGPGTVQAFRNKVQPLMQALGSKSYVPVDESIVFLRDLMRADDVRSKYEVRPLIANFFEGNEPFYDGPALVCSFGSTISNIESPISENPPETALVRGLRSLASAAMGGALLIAFDSSQDGKSIQAYYQLHDLFQLNIFDRMAVELPLSGFDPLAFDYEPLWIPQSGQLAHVAVVNRDLSFTLNGETIALSKGQRLHLKNSYKFTLSFFERACRVAGLEVMHVWEDGSPSKVCLLRLLVARRRGIRREVEVALRQGQQDRLRA